MSAWLAPSSMREHASNAYVTLRAVQTEMPDAAAKKRTLTLHTPRDKRRHAALLGAAVLVFALAVFTRLLGRLRLVFDDYRRV